MDQKESNPKDNVGIKKVSMHVISSPVLMEASLGMLDGDKKYGSHNYRVAGVRASVYYDAAMRHLMAWWEGEDIDPDSGIHHVSKVISCMSVLRDAQMNDMCSDDRPPKFKTGWVQELNKKAKEIVEKYPNPAKPYLNIDTNK
jgi:hypothetical protein